jgi:hypothetical protein
MDTGAVSIRKNISTEALIAIFQLIFSSTIGRSSIGNAVLAATTAINAPAEIRKSNIEPTFLEDAIRN